ncbi:hypothetical protein PANT_25c00014 [Moesziomyces antarcticus T-34]|uniref:Uncharacterized protein n=1 Tax=Pseudozyma antarctica (strain T-34) TaxID=1151754 RepID=M9M0S8_PSEA3|nr:hypothetical protein PANT_25c00014 [Moesziomyces antarcticus T-34]
MAPVIASTGQTRSRLPPKWMQPHRTAPKTVVADSKPLERSAPAVTRDSPVRWSTHTLAGDSNDTVRSRAESTTSTYVDTFAHRRKSRISDLTCIDHADSTDIAHLTPSQSLTSSINDLSLTLNDDDDAVPPNTAMPHDDKLAHYNRGDHIPSSDAALNPATADSYSINDDTDDDDEDDDDLAERIDRLMAATMEALEASNALVLDTLASRAKLAQLNAMEAALDSHLDTREAHLRRQITAVTDMSDFMARTTSELDKLTRIGQASRRPSVDPSSASPITALADAAGLQVRGAAAAGIVQAQDRDATIGKTAAKRLERMLHAPSTPNASPSSAASPQRRDPNPSRRAFSISNFASVQSSIAEEAPVEQQQSTSQEPPSASTTPKLAAHASSDSRDGTPPKKRSVSYDSRASSGIKLMSKLGGPSRTALPAGVAFTSAAVTAPSIAVGPSAAPLAASVPAVSKSGAGLINFNEPAGSRVHSSAKPIHRPSLMAALRQDSAQPSESSASMTRTITSQDAAGAMDPQAISGLPNYSRSTSLKAEASTASASKSAESTLAALLGMSTAPASASVSSRNETPSDSSYFDSATEGSMLSASPPTPGSMHAIRGVLATPWKPDTRDGAVPDFETPSSHERPSTDQANAKLRRVSGQYSTIVSPRASLSISDRERAGQLSSHLAELRAERVTWNSIAAAEAGTTGAPLAGSGASGGGALRALQKLNEMSAAKLAGQGGAAGEEEGSAWYAGGKRVSLGLGLPSFSALRPSASRSTSTAGPSEALPSPSFAPAPARPPAAKTESGADDKLPASVAPEGQDADAANTSSSSLLGGGWRSWTAWSAASTTTGSETSTPQRWSGRTTEL